MIDFPTSPTVGTIVTSPNGNQWRWDGTVWQSMRSVGVQTADTRGYTFYQDAVPTATRIGDTLFQPTWGTSFIWNGAAWISSDQRGYTFYQEATPTAIRQGDTWFQPSTKTSRVWTSASWDETSPPMQSGMIRKVWATSSNNNAWTTTSTVSQAIDFLTITMTPRSAISAFLVQAIVHIGWNAGADDIWMGLDRGPGAPLPNGAHAYTRGDGNTLTMRPMTAMAIDYPNTTGQFQYRVGLWVRTTGQQLYVNRRGADYVVGACSSLQVTEIV